MVSRSVGSLASAAVAAVLAVLGAALLAGAWRHLAAPVVAAPATVAVAPIALLTPRPGGVPAPTDPAGIAVPGHRPVEMRQHAPLTATPRPSASSRPRVQPAPRASTLPPAALRSRVPPRPTAIVRATAPQAVPHRIAPEAARVATVAAQSPASVPPQRSRTAAPARAVPVATAPTRGLPAATAPLHAATVATAPARADSVASAPRNASRNASHRVPAWAEKFAPRTGGARATPQPNPAALLQARLRRTPLGIDVASDAAPVTVDDPSVLPDVQRRGRHH